MIARMMRAGGALKLEGAVCKANTGNRRQHPFVKTTSWEGSKENNSDLGERRATCLKTSKGTGTCGFACGQENPNLDPWEPVPLGDPDPRVVLPAGIPTGIPAGYLYGPAPTLSSKLGCLRTGSAHTAAISDRKAFS
jgi:hypothetical protein